MFPRPVFTPPSTPASPGATFDLITTATLVVLSAVLFAMILQTGPAAAAQHIGAVLRSLPDVAPPEYDPATSITQLF